MADTTINMKLSEALMIVKHSIEMGNLKNAVAILDSLAEQAVKAEKDGD